MPINNSWYDDLNDEWWAPRGTCCLLHEMNPTRTAYFRSAMRQVLGVVRGVRVLDVGCGGGLVSEELAKAGAIVTGIDRSAPSIATARRHAAGIGLFNIEYLVGSVFDLPFADSSFDAVVSSDFLEHVSDRLDDAVGEMARVLRSGGVLAYDTINRTPKSLLLAIIGIQYILHAAPPHTHEWRMFVPPDELTLALARAGVQNQEVRGLTPARNPFAAALGLLRDRYAGGFTISKDTSLSYLGYGIKL
jgi:2-polyprenyl-6-hydroxyphenyl methylase / 3-demethylubiquinone-9 3-methyltransferase